LFRNCRLTNFANFAFPFPDNHPHEIVNQLALPPPVVDSVARAPPPRQHYDEEYFESDDESVFQAPKSSKKKAKVATNLPPPPPPPPPPNTWVPGQVVSYWSHLDGCRRVSIVFQTQSGAEKSRDLKLVLSDDNTSLTVLSRVPECLLEDQLNKMHWLVVNKDLNHYSMIKSLHNAVQAKREEWRVGDKGFFFRFVVELRFPCIFDPERTMKVYHDLMGSSRFGMVTLKEKVEVVPAAAELEWDD